MKINRDNYEEYFLLYTDHELSADLRKEVESFVQENPDLRGELEILQSLKMLPEMDIELGNKDFLLKEINTTYTALEESMLLHLDQELDAKKAASLESAIASNENLKKEWELLAKTKLQPQAVVFEGKEALYRKDRVIASVIRMQWLRYAAAAAVILIAGLFWLNRGIQDEPVQGLEIAQQVDQPNKDQNPASSSTVPSPQDGMQEKTQESASGELVGSPAAAGLSAGKEKRYPASATAQETVDKGQDGMQDKKTRLEEAGRNENLRNIEAPLVAKNLDNMPSKPMAVDITDQAVGTPEPEIRADYATRALMDQSEGESFQAEPGQGNRKGPLRGIVRKANRIYHKVTNPDMDKPLVKVASFEIALAN